MPGAGGKELTRFYFWLVAILTLVVDLASKQLVFAHLKIADVESQEILGQLLWFSRHINRGGIWGLAHGYNVVLMSLNALIVPAVVLMAYSCRAERAPYWALGMLLGGALGNLHDRILFQGVRDFIDFRWWPVFNVADIAIVVGVAAYVVWSWFWAPGEIGRQQAETEAGTASTEENVA